MIIDKIEKADTYKNLGTRINLALDYLRRTNFSNVEAGKYEIDGDNVFALVSEYKTKHVNEGKLEAHKKFLDIQFVADGKELMGYAPFKNQEIMESYKEENDVTFFNGGIDYVEFSKGMFTILFPQDLHMPGIMIENPENVKKVVVKVKI